MILALKEVSSFEAREISSSPMTIRLSGLAFHSAMVVRNISSVRDGDALQVLVHLMPTRPGYSGSFSYDLVIPDSINTVSFGNEKALIWDRSVGIVKSDPTRPPVSHNSCTYTKVPCSVVEAVQIVIDGSSIPVPRSAFCDWSDLTTAKLSVVENHPTLIASGGDASEAYEANLLRGEPGRLARHPQPILAQQQQLTP